MKSKIYKSLATHLLKGQALGIKEIDLFKNQLSSSEDYLPQTYPAVLIEFGQVVWKQLDEEGEQRGEMEVTLHVLQRNERSTMGEFINIQENNFTFLDLPEKITTRMYLYKGENTEDLRRTSEGVEVYTKTLVKQAVTYKFFVVDDSVKQLKESGQIRLTGVELGVEAIVKE